MEVVNVEYKEEVKKVSNLRFPEFEGDWYKVKLGNLIKQMQSGVSRKLSDQDIGYPILRSNNLQENMLDVSDIKYWYTNDDQGANLKNYILCKGDLLVNFINSIAKIGKVALFENILQRDTIFTTNLMRLSFNDNVNVKFAFYHFLLNGYNEYISSITKPAVNQASFTTKDFQKYILNLPPLPEQQKIASFLSAVDQKIQQFTRKKELLEQYKKGVMQKLFSQEIRFKDENGKDYPDWEEKQLGDILTFISTNSLSRNDLNYKSGEIRNIHYGDIHTTFKMGFDVEKEKIPFINEKVDLRRITEDQFCKVGDVVIADASEDYNDIGKAIEVLNVGNEKIVAGLHTFLARDTSGQTIKGFKGYLFQTWQVRKQIMKIAQGISVLGISKKNLAIVEFLLPCREEQRQITTLIQNIDKRITNTLNQINQTQQFKKGLLQQMFV